MLTRAKLIIPLTAALITVPASAASVYVINAANQFGTIDLATGAFQQIGPSMPEPATGLTPGPNGSLLTLAVSGSLNAINPVSGVTTVVGSTGLGDCSLPTSPCGPNSASVLGGLGGTIYATDLANNLYNVNSSTGAATLIGKTGIPALPFVPLSTNPDGTFNAYDEVLFGANGKLYATFDAFTIDSTTFTLGSVLIPDNLYQIDPTTGAATVIGPTDLNLAAVADVNGTFYAFNDGTSQIVTLDVANGKTSFVTDFDPAVGLVVGAAPTPEPLSTALVGVGLMAIALCRRRRGG